MFKTTLSKICFTSLFFNWTSNFRKKVKNDWPMTMTDETNRYWSPEQLRWPRHLHTEFDQFVLQKHLWKMISLIFWFIRWRWWFYEVADIKHQIILPLNSYKGRKKAILRSSPDIRHISTDQALQLYQSTVIRILIRDQKNTRSINNWFNIAETA